MTADQDSNKIGALKAFLDARMRQMELMQIVGLLPRNLGALKVDLDVRALVGIILDVFNEDDVPMSTQEKIMAIVQARGAPPILETGKGNGSSLSLSSV